MRTLICVTVLALVASAVASPAFNRAAINSLDQLAKIESFFCTLKKVGEMFSKELSGVPWVIDKLSKKMI